MNDIENRNMLYFSQFLRIMALVFDEISLGNRNK